MRRITLVAVLFLSLAANLAAQKPAKGKTSAPLSGEARAARYLDQVRDDPSLLLDFIRRLPKGGDLHNHLSGAVYAESYLKFAAQDNLCLNRQSFELSAPTIAPADSASDGKQKTCDATKNLVAARQALGDAVLYRDAINAWSMRHFTANGEVAADHFFDTFRKFGPVTANHVPEMLAEVVSRAGHENVQYLELILDPTKKQPANHVGQGMGVKNDDFAALRQQVLDKGIERVVAAARVDLDDAERRMRDLLRCGAMDADPGCTVTVRYIYEVHRSLPPDMVFAEMVAGFEMANADARVVGINMVAPEDGFVSMRDFGLHMRMMNYLHTVYPKVRITLHAGELSPSLVPPEGLRYHIRDSVEVGGAERIGHGDDVMYERDPIQLLQEMARRNILVEVCLTSNDLILGVRGMQHPLPMYLRFGVPVALATDDEGVSRSDLVQEFVRAVQTYKLSYAELKRMVRNSAEHSFLPGESLWASLPQDGAPKRIAACAADTPSNGSAACRKFLDSSQRAQLQWRIEAAFEQFQNRDCCVAAAAKREYPSNQPRSGGIR